MNKMFKFPMIISTVLSVIAGAASADTKIGMITTLSGGGAGLGVDVREMALCSQSINLDDPILKS